jgi:hypothetical protein
MGFKSVFKTVAPFLAQTVQLAAPGPLGNIAAGILTKAAGATVKPEDLENKMAQMAQTDDGLLKLKQAEDEFKLQMTQLGFDSVEKLAELDVQDRDSARKREETVKDNTPKILAYGVMLLAIAISIILISGNSPVMKDTTSAAMAGTVIGYIFNEVKQVFSYYFGSSSGSDRKTELLAKAPAVE